LVLGYSCLALLVCAFVGQSEVAQYVQTTQGYNKPFFLTWLNHGAMGIILPLLAAHARFSDGSSLRVRLEAVCRLPLHRIALVCCGLSLVYTLGDYIWYVSLDLTSVAEATALFNSQSAFTYAFSICLLGEQLRCAKLASVGISILGLAVIGAYGGADAAPPAPPALLWSPSPVAAASPAGSRVLGDALVAGAAAAYALYEVSFARALRPGHAAADVLAVNALTGLVGVCSTVVTAPGIGLLHACGVETFQLPERGGMVGWIALSAGLALVFNVCLMLSVACLSPLTAALGCTLTIPLASLVDWLWHTQPPRPADLTGAAFIVAGFLLLLATQPRPALPHAPGTSADRLAPEAGINGSVGCERAEGAAAIGGGDAARAGR
jgi:drug/metabolite transporter (DMT)-like permease